MGLSNYALEMMGFTPFHSSDAITAYFKSINVYEMRGVKSVPQVPFEPDKLKRVFDELTISIGETANAACRALIGDDFVEDELKWQKEKGTSPPYLLVLTALPEPVTCKSGYWKHEKNSIITHDCFTVAKESLRVLERNRTAAFVTALSVELSTPRHCVKCIPIAREVFGVTTDKKTLRDFRLIGQFDLVVASSFTAEEISSRVDVAWTVSRELHPKVGYFYSLGVREKDVLKKFLYFFLVIEIHTHQEFKKINHTVSFRAINTIPKRLDVSGAQFLVEHQKDAKKLFDRFMWCALLRWKDVDDEDISQFIRIKKCRDRIYHGEEVKEGELPVDRTLQLALKILRGSRGQSC